MTCRHEPGDPNCSSHPRHYSSYDHAPSKTPDASNYKIVAAERVGAHLVLKVKYPNCAACSFEGCKVMVFLNVTELQALVWRKIDPHFRGPAPAQPYEAPSPAARFPASTDGWRDALAYASTRSARG